MAFPKAHMGLSALTDATGMLMVFGSALGPWNSETAFDCFRLMGHGQQLVRVHSVEIALLNRQRARQRWCPSSSRPWHQATWEPSPTSSLARARAWTAFELSRAIAIGTSRLGEIPERGCRKEGASREMGDYAFETSLSPARLFVLMECVA